MTAVDLDGPQNNIIHYAIVSGDPWQQFSIDPLTGHIKVRSVLDREEVSSFMILEKKADVMRDVRLVFSAPDKH